MCQASDCQTEKAGEKAMNEIFRVRQYLDKQLWSRRVQTVLRFEKKRLPKRPGDVVSRPGEFHLGREVVRDLSGFTVERDGTCETLRTSVPPHQVHSD